MIRTLGPGLLALALLWPAPTVAETPTDAPQATRDTWRARLDDARTRQIERLKAYAEAGRFPRNHRIFGQVPIFVDSDGATCAVAHLMTLDGRQDEVKAIAGADNHIYVEDIADGPVVDWVRFSGLLIEEAALIQPGYTRWRKYDVKLDTSPGVARFAVEDARLRAHFATVVEQLERHRQAAIETALERAWPHIAAGRAP